MANWDMKPVASPLRQPVNPTSRSSPRSRARPDAARSRSRRASISVDRRVFLLTVTAGPSVGGSVRLTTSTAIVGRSPDAQLTVQDPRVSTRHLLLRHDPAVDAYRVRDLNSTNGTFVQHRKLTSEVRLQDGDEIMIGNSRLRFTFEPDPQLAAPGA